MTPVGIFHSQHYLEINDARLVHLGLIIDRMGIELSGMTVLELGAGIGDHSAFWIDRGCKVTITEARDENLDIIRQRYPDQDVRMLNLDVDVDLTERFDIVYAYGILYHLADPDRAIATIGRLCSGMCFLETCVSYGAEALQNATEEPTDNPSQAISGIGCRPTRKWIFDRLLNQFGHVYQPGSQPAHPQFPLDWRAGAEADETLVRSVFVASRDRLHSPFLHPQLLDRQALELAGSAQIASISGLPLAMRSLDIATVIDGGANVGQFAEGLRAEGYGGKIVSFEPLSDVYPVLQARTEGDQKWTACNVALGDNDGIATINISANSFSSSLLVAEDRTLTAEPTVEFIGSQDVRISRLDTIWHEVVGPDDGPIMLKLDVQGFEPQVLEGAGEKLETIAAVLLETSLVPVYVGEKVLTDMLELMRGMGFHPVWMKPGWSHNSTGQVYQCDVLFSRMLDLPVSGVARR